MLRLQTLFKIYKRVSYIIILKKQKVYKKSIFLPGLSIAGWLAANLFLNRIDFLDREALDTKESSNLINCEDKETKDPDHIDGEADPVDNLHVEDIRVNGIQVEQSNCAEHARQKLEMEPLHFHLIQNNEIPW